MHTYDITRYRNHNIIMFKRIPGRRISESVKMNTTVCKSKTLKKINTLQLLNTIVPDTLCYVLSYCIGI